ncbi:MAG: GIY-YIG nuclease family protein [Gloeocapsa sp. UFS-A4-WI-NPMV-4B04]|jgi:predicted GIY-YIG superfamily endonuclease/DNA-binding XRE family transcriptional regulator|nr:GIY-YIG nuclease family protein [Gloeocapsa sp. UFS-A4-WI-NPMV-4B04]
MPARKDTNVISHRLNDPTLEKLQTISTVNKVSVASLVRDFTEQTANREIVRLEFLTSISEAGGVELSVLAGATTRLVEGANKWSIASGIYALFNEATRSLYVGSSSCLSKRIKAHSRDIANKNHHNDALNNWLVDDVFVTELEHCKAEALFQREQHWIDTLRKCDAFQLANIANPVSQGRENEKVVATRMDTAVVEKLEMLAVFHDQTVGALLRTAVREFIEKEQRHIHPLSLEAAVSLASSLGIDTNDIFNSACHLTSSLSFGNAGGVYLLVHPDTRELYVGSSTELTARLTHHKFSIKTSTHKNAAINSWVLDDVVVVILEKCEAKKNAATKKALLAREQHFIDVLKLSKDWTLLNLATATLTAAKETPTVIAGVPKNSSSGRGSSQGIVSPPSKEAPSTTIAAAAPPTTTAFETFYSTVIEQALIPILDEQKNSRDLVNLFEH